MGKRITDSYDDKGTVSGEGAGSAKYIQKPLRVVRSGFSFLA
jgi:hypothetical protein